MRQRLSFTTGGYRSIVSIILQADSISGYPICSPGYYFKFNPFKLNVTQWPQPRPLNMDTRRQGITNSDSFTVKYDATKHKFLVALSHWMAQFLGVFISLYVFFKLVLFVLGYIFLHTSKSLKLIISHSLQRQVLVN